MLALALFLAVCAGARARNFNITYFEIPQLVPRGKFHAVVECRYDANFTYLSFFKGSQEFFRYRPGAAPSTRSFPIPGVDTVEMIFCGPEACQLRLGGLTEEATDMYRCDIEKDVPPYRFATRTAHMEVQARDRRKPLLEGLAEEYTDGDMIQAYCWVGPNSELRWYINGREVPDTRNSPSLKVECTKYLFMGIPPTAVVQCAEYRFGRIYGSIQQKTRWNGISRLRKPETNVKNGSNVIAGRLGLLSIFLCLINKNYM